MKERWINVRSCHACARDLTQHEIFHSDGRCPYCGDKAPSAGTIVKTRERAVKIQMRAFPKLRLYFRWLFG